MSHNLKYDVIIMGKTMNFHFEITCDDLITKDGVTQFLDDKRFVIAQFPSEIIVVSLKGDKAKKIL